MLVPEMMRVRVGIGQAENTSTPGAAISTAVPGASTLSWAEKSAMSRLRSTAPTAMNVRLLAGRPTKPVSPFERRALLPAAAISRVPALSARCPTVS
ncbi:hypothetical protein D3C80_1383660 [compost metagenome]